MEYGSGSSAREAGGTNGAGPGAHALREVWEVVPSQRVADGHCTFRARLPSVECYSEAGELHDRHAAGVPGSVKRQFWQSLIAVLAGNAIYFSVERFLPARVQHQLFQIDFGLAVDFWICLVCYGLVRLIR